MRFHHICLVVPNLEEGIENLSSTLDLEIASEITIDPIQKVRVVFLKDKKGDLSYELVEPIDPTSPVNKALQEKSSLNHLCFEVDDIDDKIKELQESGNLLISGPVEATAFSGKRIAFFYMRSRMIIELVESERGAVK